MAPKNRKNSMNMVDSDGDGLIDGLEEDTVQRLRDVHVSAEFVNHTLRPRLAQSVSLPAIQRAQ